MAFLLPCSQCGHKLVVNTGQAGEQLRCQCGARLDVPTVRALRGLETAPVAARPSSAWTARQSVILAGVLVAIVGLAFGGYMHLRAWQVMPKETFADKIRMMEPAELWDLWSQYLRIGIGWQPQIGPAREAAIKKADELRRWAIVGYSIGGVGLVTAIAGLTLMGSRPQGASRRTPNRRAPAPQNK